MKKIIIYAGKHYGCVHVVVRRDSATLTAIHEPSGDTVTVNRCDTEDAP